MSKDETYVLAECINCGTTKKVSLYEMSDNEMPVCDKCGMPMIAKMGMTKKENEK